MKPLCCIRWPSGVSECCPAGGGREFWVGHDPHQVSQGQGGRQDMAVIP